MKGFQRNSFQPDSFQSIPLQKKGFQYTSFQTDAFQVAPPDVVSTVQAAQDSQSFGSVVTFYQPGAGPLPAYGGKGMPSHKPFWDFNGEIVSVQDFQNTRAKGKMAYVGVSENQGMKALSAGEGFIYNFEEEARIALSLLTL